MISKMDRDGTKAIIIIIVIRQDYCTAQLQYRAHFDLGDVKVGRSAYCTPQNMMPSGGQQQMG